MSLTKKLRKAARKLKKRINRVADRIADSIETAGNKAQDWAHDFANQIRDSVPIIGPVLGAVVDVFGAIASGAFDIAGAAVKAAGSTIGGGLAGGLLMLGGMFKDGFRELASGFLGGGLLVVGKFVSLVQIIFHTEQRKRPLTEKEAAMLKGVFRDSVALYNVRLILGRSGVFDFNDREFTMGNTIYMKRTSPADADWDETLVHETTHVWQYQNIGSSYASGALGAQSYYEALGEDAYVWSDPDVNGGDMDWETWNEEAQASFIDDVFEFGSTSADGVTWVEGDGRFYGAAPQRRFHCDGIDHTAVAEATVAVLRADVSVRDSLGMM